MGQNPFIPTVKVAQPVTKGSTSDFASSSHPASGRFYLVFTEQFISNLLNTTLTYTTDDTNPIPLVTGTGGNVHTDMLYNAIMLRRSGACCCPCCNPYTFRAIRMYDPDRVVICDRLPATSSSATAVGTSGDGTGSANGVTTSTADEDDTDPATKQESGTDGASTDLAAFGF